MYIKEVQEASLREIQVSSENGVRKISEALFIKPDMINLVYGRPDIISYAKFRGGRALNVIGAGEAPQIRGYSSEEALYMPTSFEFANTYKITYEELRNNNIIKVLESTDGKKDVAVRNENLLLQKILQVMGRASDDMQNTIKNILHGVFNGSTSLSKNSQAVILTSNGVLLSPVATSWANSSASISNDMTTVQQSLILSKMSLYGTILDEFNANYLYNNQDLRDNFSLVNGGNVIANALGQKNIVFGQLALSERDITSFINADNEELNIIDPDFAYYLPKQRNGLPIVEIMINAPRNKPNVSQFDSNNGLYFRTQSNIKGIADNIGGEYVPTFETEKEECIEITVGASISVIENTLGIRRQRVIL